MKLSAALDALPVRRQEAALFAATLVWGTTFLIIHTAMRFCGPMVFVGVRFLTAALASLLLFRPKLADLTWPEVGASLAIGATIFLGYGLQTVGLKTISSSQSAFITAFYVPLVPLLQWLVLKRPPKALTALGTVLAFVGLILVAGTGAHGLRIGFGEAVSILGTIAVAAEILLLGYYAPRIDARRASVVELAAASLMAFVAMPVSGEAWPAFSWVWVAAALGLGLASAGIQLAINWAQQSVSPTRATLIYAGEPVWAGVFGRLAGDRLPGPAQIGAVLIVAGMVVSGLKPTDDKNWSA